MLLLAGMLIFPAMGTITVLAAWLAAKGYPSTWDRTTYVLAFPVIEIVGAGLFYVTRRWAPIETGPFVAKEVLGYGPLLLIAIGGGCCLGVFTYGRLRQSAK